MRQASVITRILVRANNKAALPSGDSRALYLSTHKRGTSAMPELRNINIRVILSEAKHLCILFASPNSVLCLTTQAWALCHK